MKSSHTFKLTYFRQISPNDGPLITIENGHNSCESCTIRWIDYMTEVKQEGMTSFYKKIVNWCNEHGRDVNAINCIIYYCDDKGKIVGMELFETGDIFDLLPIAMNTMTSFYR